MKTLLIGGLGFIGKHLIRKIGDSNTLTVFTDPEAKSMNDTFIKDYNLNVEVGDIRDGTYVKEVISRSNPEVVVHLAALTGIGRCNENPSLAFSVNVFGTYNIVMGCAASKAKLIFISSREVYGESLSDRTQEDAPLNPNNIYGVTKLLGENLVKWASVKRNLDYTILRLTNVYGPEGDQYGIQVMIRKALTEGKIQILGRGQLMNLVYVEDVTEAIQNCLDNKKSSNQILNIGSHDDSSLEEIVSKLVKILDMPIKIDYLPMRKGETLNFKPNLEKAEKITGYGPKFDLNKGLQETVKWYRNKLQK